MSETSDRRTETDLFMQRPLIAPRELVWCAWTKADYVKEWWCPKPWTTPFMELDLRPGGKFNFRMRGPNGEEDGAEACIIDVAEKSRIVFTDALSEGWRPSAKPFITAVITLEDCPGGTLYGAHVLHKDAATRQRHEEMGFFEGWGAVSRQLEAFALTLNKRRT